MKPEKKSFLERVLGKDRADNLDKALGEASATLRQQNVESKEVKPDPKTAIEVKAETKTVEPAKVEPEVSEAEEKAIKELADIVATVKEMGKALPDMVKRIEAVESANKALVEESTKLKAEIKKSQDEIVAQAWTPRSAFAYVASKAEDNKVQPGDEVATAKPAVDQQFMASMGMTGK